MEFIIRQAEESDIENIARLEKQCFSQEAWSQEAVQDGMRVLGRYFFVATNGEQHLGHACITNIFGEAEITNVAVATEFRRAGIASRLMEALIVCGKENKSREFTLEVRENNVAAIKLYESFGFVSEGIRPHFYKDPDEGAMIMWKR